MQRCPPPPPKGPRIPPSQQRPRRSNAAFCTGAAHVLRRQAATADRLMGTLHDNCTANTAQCKPRCPPHKTDARHKNTALDPVCTTQTPTSFDGIPPPHPSAQRVCYSKWVGQVVSTLAACLEVLSSIPGEEAPAAPRRNRDQREEVSGITR